MIETVGRGQTAVITVVSANTSGKALTAMLSP